MSRSFAKEDEDDMDMARNAWDEAHKAALQASSLWPSRSICATAAAASPSSEVMAPLLSLAATATASLHPPEPRSAASPAPQSATRLTHQLSPLLTTLHFEPSSEAAAWQSFSQNVLPAKYISYAPALSYPDSGNSIVKVKANANSILDMDPFEQASPHQAFEMAELGLSMPTAQVEYEPPSIGTQRKPGFWSRLFSRSASPSPSTPAPASSPLRLSNRSRSLSAALLRPKALQSKQSHGCLARFWHWLPSPNPDQRHTLVILGLQLCLALTLYNVPYGEHIIYPFHLMGVLFHELGHASMAWLTGATVVSIRIGPEVDGATVIKGGSQCVILPAGYLGAAFAGSLLLFCGFSESASLYLSLGIDAFCILTIFLAADVFTFVATIVVLSLFVATVMFGGRLRGPIVRYTVCMMGVLASTFSCWDIVDDLIRKVVPESDAYKFATHCLYCPSAIVGVFWFLISCVLVCSSVIIGLKVFKTPRSIK